MFLIFDTETTGFVNPRKAADDPEQCHLVQIAAQLVKPDNMTVMEFSLIVNPGVPIPPRASEVHGITDEIAQEYGVSPNTAVDFFKKLYGHADMAVAHNISFDKKVMELALARRHPDLDPPRIQIPTYCTMEKAKPVVKQPPTKKMVAAGRTGFKSPNLTECIKHFFGEDLENSHNAMVDTIACRRVFFQLNPTGAVK